MSPTTVSERRWVFAPADPDAAQRLSIEAGVTPMLAQLLMNRGVSGAEAARDFLRPELKGLHDPFLLPGVEEAAGRIAAAVAKGEKIVVYGDYDVDGVTATAIMLEAVTLAGGKAEYYLPHRQEEGYGLNADAVRALAAEGARLIVTVDCGVTAVEEIALARKLGVDVIVTDHHEPGPAPPDALAVINPHLPGSPYPFQHLSGAGVAFKLAWALAKALSPEERVTPEFRSFLLEAVNLAALGTIADVVPLCGENRILANYGLRGIGCSERPGLRELCRIGSIRDGVVRSWDVAFRLAPRLNAAGRLGCARRSVELLTTRDEETAARLARELDRENTARRAIQDDILAQALEMADAAGGPEARGAFVLADERWNPGVVGIVAGQIAERLCRPTVVIALNGDPAHGSARSAGRINLYEAVSICADLLDSFGGHERAAGVRVARGKIDAFRERFERAVAGQAGGEGIVSTLDIEVEARLGDLDFTLIREIEALEPFGEGNASPLFGSLGLKLASPAKRIGAGGKHLAFWVTQDGVGVRAIAFNMGPLADALNDCDAFCVAYEPRVNEYRGRRSLEIEVKDIKFGAFV